MRKVSIYEHCQNRRYHRQQPRAGFSLALQCLQRGANVVISSENEMELHDALNRLQASVAGRVCDVSKCEDVVALRAFALECFGAVDVWINNAGISTPTGAVLPLLFRRLVLREPPPCNADAIGIAVVEPVSYSYRNSA